MTYIITQSCCNDASCVQACPVGCIHPTPGEPGFSSTEMLHIDPASCIDCGACADACPVNAVYADDELPDTLAHFRKMNADYYESSPATHVPEPLPDTRALTATAAEPLRVAIVGAGPAGFYAASELFCRDSGAEVSMIEKLAMPFGLVRYGVAPDHQSTKEVAQVFREVAANPRFSTFYNVEVGRHLSHKDLLEHHHAVIYSCGASQPRKLDVPGENLPGSVSAAEFVAWYNGHPDMADASFDLSGERAVIVGNGNVALDVARMLLLPPDQLACTDIADNALNALRESTIREVVLLGRRDPSSASFTTPEIGAFGSIDNIEIAIDAHDLSAVPPARSFAQKLKTDILTSLADRTTGRSRTANKRLVLQFCAVPVALDGTGRVETIRIARTRVSHERDVSTFEITDEVTTLKADLVVCATGYRGEGRPDVPFDIRTATMPNIRGRVMEPETSTIVLGTYAAGWIKRGPTGVIGTNRVDAAESVTALLEDHAVGLLAGPNFSGAAFAELVEQRQPDRVDRTRWQRIDETEIARGRTQGRPRVKFTDRATMLAVANGSGKDNAR